MEVIMIMMTMISDDHLKLVRKKAVFTRKHEIWYYSQMFFRIIKYNIQSNL